MVGPQVQRQASWVADETRGHVPGWQQTGPEAGFAHLMARAGCQTLTPGAQGLRDAHRNTKGPGSQTASAMEVGTATTSLRGLCRGEAGKEQQAVS